MFFAVYFDALRAWSDTSYLLDKGLKRKKENLVTRSFEVAIIIRIGRGNGDGSSKQVELGAESSSVESCR